MRRDYQEYIKIRDEFLKDKIYCGIKSPVCTRKVDCVHHMKGRIGGNLTNPEFFIESCGPCNLYVERYPKWALSQGKSFLKLSRKTSKTPLFEKK